MQIKILTGAAATGKTRKLREIEASLVSAKKAVTFICGEHYSSTALLAHVSGRANQGPRTLLIDDCSQQQINDLRGWQAAMKDNDHFKKMTIWVAKRA